MSDVIDIGRCRKEPQFMFCPCIPEGGTVTPVIVLEKGVPLITHVVCIECECGYSVVNGFIREESLQ